MWFHSRKSDIDLPYKERKSLYAFLALFGLFVAIITLLISYIYFAGQKELELQKNRPMLLEHSEELIERLRWLHINFDRNRTYPRDERFQSAILDSEGVLIFSTLKTDIENLNRGIYYKDGYIHFIAHPESYYLGAKYIVVEIKEDSTWRRETLLKILYYSSSFILLSLVIGFFLVRLFLRPLRGAIALLNRFIQDTTHELNTPVSTILTNIESIDVSSLESDNQRKIERIKIGAKMVSNIYEDLTYLCLHREIKSHEEVIDVGGLLLQRVEFFKTLASSKKISIELEIKDGIEIKSDRYKMTKIVDNILSNSIKYSKIGGRILVGANERGFYIKDFGFGIPKKRQKEIFERFSRFQSSVGGFGIGLNIVKKVASELGFKIEIESEEHKGCEVKILW